MVDIAGTAGADAVGDDEDLGNFVDGHDCSQAENSEQREGEQCRDDGEREADILEHYGSGSAGVVEGFGEGS